MANDIKHNAEERGLSQLDVNDLITEPLLAVARAQNKIAEEQVHSLLKICFDWDEENEVFRPKLIRMTITRAVIVEENIGGDNRLDQIVTYFDIPLISIFPFTSLAVEKVNIAFGINIISQYRKNYANNASKINRPSIQPSSDIKLLAKLAGDSTKNQFAKEKKPKTDEITADYTIDVLTGSLPLPKGLLSIIDIYTSAIDPAAILSSTKPTPDKSL